MTPFGDRLAARVAKRESQVVLGLDPDPARLWPQAGGDVAAHLRAVIDAAASACVAVKPQVACFERLGVPGWEALQATIEHARAAGLLVLADAKRGDIDISAQRYAEAFLADGGLEADALTVNPYLGADSLEPFVAAARANGAGLFVLVRTSNPGAADLQDLELAAGGRVWEHTARLVDGLGSAGESGLSEVGAVVGATAPEHLARARELMPQAVFLLPGIGAQGGRVEDLAPAFAPGRAGGLVTSSRSIVFAFERDGGEPADAARAEAERLRGAAWALA
ncbi:MAG TPA: orotidine-5'-phosphate decarboxylase [Solirubrobacteraceae bacterium]|nr:orotidine-5'-phosphate decarboxylase [Solirubrobacteraceae bacterium]